MLQLIVGAIYAEIWCHPVRYVMPRGSRGPVPGPWPPTRRDRGVAVDKCGRAGRGASLPSGLWPSRNAEPTPYDDMAAEVVREPISEAIPRLLHAVS